MSGSALVVGVGPGLGWAVARRLAKGGRKVAVAARSKDKLEVIVGGETPLGIRALACDATDPASVERCVDEAEQSCGPLDVVVFNAGSFTMSPIVDTEPADFEHAWRVGCYAGFLVGRAAAKRMLPRERGTVLFTGATASLRGVVIVDTSGRPISDGTLEAALGTDAIRSSERTGRRTDVLLCVCASLRASDAARVQRGYAVTAPTSIAVTKLDETDAASGLVHAAFVTQLPISTLCFGQRVPEDISPATSELVARWVAGEGT